VAARWRRALARRQFEDVLKAHNESSFSSAIHARIRAQIANVEARGKKRVRKNLLNFEGKVDRSAVLGLLTGWLFNYNTIEQLMLFAAVIVCLMGIMYQANTTTSFYPGALDGVTAVVMIDIIAAIIYYFTVLFAEIAILYNEDNNRKRLERAAETQLGHLIGLHDEVRCIQLDRGLEELAPPGRMGVALALLAHRNVANVTRT
jgi:hypothetical protein